VKEWIPFLTVLAVPILVTGDRGRLWLTDSSFAHGTWVLLVTFAVVGAIASLLLYVAPVQRTAAALVATPLVQALTFVLSDKVFRLIVDRPPVAFDEARFGLAADGTRYWSDRFFWLLMYLVLPILGVSVCVEFGIDLPSRGHR
jgi:hypothetical protein